MLKALKNLISRLTWPSTGIYVDQHGEYWTAFLEPHIHPDFGCIAIYGKVYRNWFGRWQNSDEILTWYGNTYFRRLRKDFSDDKLFPPTE